MTTLRATIRHENIACAQDSRNLIVLVSIDVVYYLGVCDPIPDTVDCRGY
jgi:hypothetical protein